MADGDVKDLQNLISSIDENSKSTTDNINQILGILQNLDRGGISSNKKNNKKTGADNTSSVTSMLKAVNNVTPKLQTFSTNINDINRGLKSLSNTISKFNQGIKSESVSGNKNDKAPRNAAFDSTFFTDVKTVLSDIKSEIADFHKSFKDGLQDISNREVAESKKDAQQDAKAKKLNVKDIRAKQEAGERLTQEERTALIKDNKRLKKNKLIGNAISGVAGGISSFATGNIDSSSAINKGIDMLTNVSPWFALLKIAKAGADIYNKEEGYGRDYARTYGGGQYGKSQFMEQSSNFRRAMPAKYGYTAEDYYNGAVNITNNTGREIYRQSNANIKSAIDLKRMGIEGEELGMFDTFGRSMQSTDEYFNKLYGRAGSKGLSFKKMTDAIKSNLKMAQTYTFSRGVDGLQKMAETSTRLKYNMSEVARFAEKVNTVEGAIKTSANLSVLGGDFAQFSNPMGLLYESLNDMEGLNDRMVEMFSKMAKWDSSKGQIEIGAYDKQRIRVAAEAMGVDANEMMNIAMNRQRESMVEGSARRAGIKDEETLDYIKNLAQLNKKGQAYISDTNNTLGRGAGAEILLNDPEFQKLIPQLKDESERKNNAENKGIGDVYNETKSIYDTLDLYLKGISGKLGALVTHFLGGSGSMTASQKGFWASMSGEEKDALAERRGYASRKELRRAVKLGELNDAISEKFGGDKNRQFIDKNYDKYKKLGAENSYRYSGHGKQGKLNFANDVAEGAYKNDVNDFFEEQKNNRAHHVGIVGNTNEHFARILRGESVLTRRGTDILGKSNVRALNSGQLPAFEKIRLRTAHDYLNNLPVTPSITQRYNQAQGQQKITFEPITLTINGQFNVNSGNQFRNIPLDDIDTRALKKAILDTVTENIPTIMRKANILNNRGYDMENDRYRGAIQGSYI